MNLGSVAARVRAGETVTFKAHGNSMTGRIDNGATVTVGPVDVSKVRKGDVVLVRVNGRWLLHLVSGVSHNGSRVQISNNHGRVNGWTAVTNIAGALT